MASARTVLCVRLALAGTMAFIAGWVDIVCMTRYSAFATMMTGNVLQLGKSILAPSTKIWSGPWFYSGLIAAYIFGLVVHQILERRFKHKTAVLFAPVLAAGVMAVELLDRAFANGHVHWYNNKLSVIFLAPLFAAQSNIALRGGLMTVTSMATGHIHSLMYWFGQAAHPRGMGELSAENKRKIPMSIMVIFSLMAGAGSGAELIRANKDPPQCSLQPNCLGLDGDCCPTSNGVYLECCAPDDTTQWMLLPCGPVLALALVIHDCLFWPGPPKEQQKEHLLAEVQLQNIELSQAATSQMVQSPAPQVGPPPTSSASRGSRFSLVLPPDVPRQETMLDSSPIAMSGMGYLRSDQPPPSFSMPRWSFSRLSSPGTSGLVSSSPPTGAPPLASIREASAASGLVGCCSSTVGQRVDPLDDPSANMD